MAAPAAEDPIRDGTERVVQGLQVASLAEPDIRLAARCRATAPLPGRPDRHAAREPMIRGVLHAGSPTMGDCGGGWRAAE